MNSHEAFDFFDLADRQRAHRCFTAEAVPAHIIEKLLTTATRAPSAENSQPWEFIVVTNADLRAQLGDLMRQQWLDARAFSESRLCSQLFAEVDAGLGEGGIAKAPALIVAAADTRKVHRAAIASSIFPAIQNLLLGATALGLGSALTTIATMNAKGLRMLLDIGEHLDPVALIPIGYPPKTLGRSRREPATTRTTWRR